MDRDGVFTRGDVGAFEQLPLLAVRTVVDGRGTERIEECNDAFVRRLDLSSDELTGRPLRSVYASETTPDTGPEKGPWSTRSDGGDSWPWSSAPAADEPSNFDGATVGDRERLADSSSGADPTDGPQSDRADWRHERWVSHLGASTVEHCLVGGDGRLIHTLVEGVPRRDARGRVLFHIDVTRRKHRERQADVLNRLMRHNVRNDLNLLRGHARTLAEHDDEEVAASAEVIDRIADRWIGLAEKARQIERLFDEDAGGTVTLEHLTNAVRTSVTRDWPESTVRASIEVDPALSVSERLHPAVVELCENGIKHADCQVVTVTISASDAAGYVDVQIADRGPGIPDHERVALFEEEETPLRHGSGLGFWIVRFIIRQLGGAISVGDDDYAGGVVVLSVPLVEEEARRS
ncbi:sensor histidine kinase [Halobellus sp. EA9]|uniref:sensor histidine kinase n=1 Tax=Halobellus sp. EA9 TaxID=3421647 RepID=UPI003EBD8AC4